KLLRTANTAQVLPALVTEYGRPDERHWLWRHLHEILSDTAPATLQHRYRCARHFTALAGRCLSQRRHYLSLRVLGACLQPSLLDDPLCREVERRVDDIRRLESAAGLGPATVEALPPRARTPPAGVGRRAGAAHRGGAAAAGADPAAEPGGGGVAPDAGLRRPVASRPPAGTVARGPGRRGHPRGRRGAGQGLQPPALRGPGDG